jgi:hypothetical protein
MYGQQTLTIPRVHWLTGAVPVPFLEHSGSRAGQVRLLHARIKDKKEARGRSVQPRACGLSGFKLAQHRPPRVLPAVRRKRGPQSTARVCVGLADGPRARGCCRRQ